MTEPTSKDAPVQDAVPQDQAARIAELEAQLRALQGAQPAAGDAMGNPREPTHLQALACGCSDRVTVPAATHHECADHGLTTVVAYHELPRVAA